MALRELDLADEQPSGQGLPITVEREQPFDPNRDREGTRGDLARGLLWLLTFSIGGVLAFIALGRLDGTVLTQSIFPSLIALAGTALGFYFGSQTPGAVGQQNGSAGPGDGGQGSRGSAGSDQQSGAGAGSQSGTGAGSQSGTALDPTVTVSDPESRSG